MIIDDAIPAARKTLEEDYDVTTLRDMHSRGLARGPNLFRRAAECTDPYAPRAIRGGAFHGFAVDSDSAWSSRLSSSSSSAVRATIRPSSRRMNTTSISSPLGRRKEELSNGDPFDTANTSGYRIAHHVSSPKTTPETFINAERSGGQLTPRGRRPLSRRADTFEAAHKRAHSKAGR